MRLGIQAVDSSSHVRQSPNPGVITGLKGLIMSTSNISGAKQRQIKAGVAEIVGTKLAKLDAAAGDRLIAKLAEFGEHVKPGLIAAIDRFSAVPPVVLKLVNANVQLDAITSYNPSKFKTRKGLWVSDDFQSRVGKKAKPVKGLPAITLASGDLVKNAYDKEIKADPILPANPVFQSESEFVAYLDQMISKQPNGKEGDLLVNDYWNIFYVPGCVVSVCWYGDLRRWLVGAWGLGGFWCAGRRAFGRN